jgi:hypothetical protein
MSWKLVGEILNLNIKNPTDKLLLVGIAQHCVENTTSTPGLDRLIRYCGVKKRHVQSRLQYWRDEEVLSIEKKGVGRGNNTTYGLDIDKLKKVLSTPPFHLKKGVVGDTEKVLPGARKGVVGTHRNKEERFERLKEKGQTVESREEPESPSKVESKPVLSSPPEENQNPDQNLSREADLPSRSPEKENQTSPAAAVLNDDKWIMQQAESEYFEEFEAWRKEKWGGEYVFTRDHRKRARDCVRELLAKAEGDREQVDRIMHDAIRDFFTTKNKQKSWFAREHPQYHNFVKHLPDYADEPLTRAEVAAREAARKEREEARQRDLEANRKWRQERDREQEKSERLVHLEEGRVSCPEHRCDLDLKDDQFFCHRQYPCAGAERLTRELRELKALPELATYDPPEYLICTNCCCLSEWDPEQGRHVHECNREPVDVAILDQVLPATEDDGLFGAFTV